MSHYNRRQFIAYSQFLQITYTKLFLEYYYQHIGRCLAEVLLGNGLIQTMLNNSRTHSMAQMGVPNPAWGNASSDRLGFDGTSRAIAKRCLAGGINGTTHAYDDTAPVVGFTTQYRSFRQQDV